MSSSSRHQSADLFLIEESGEERMNRVDDIRRRVASGDYQVPASAVADAVVAFFSRTLSPAAAPDAGNTDDTC